jgi:deazaflavin-dependent oxidoreductase (nitroreductase family)
LAWVVCQDLTPVDGESVANRFRRHVQRSRGVPVSVPADLWLTAMNRFHCGLLAISNGRVGWRLAGMPVLALTTTGRRSGQLHTVMLTSPVQDDHALVIVASRGGDDRHPAWFLNLLANPDVAVAFVGKPKQADARPGREPRGARRVGAPGDRRVHGVRPLSDQDSP